MNASLFDTNYITLRRRATSEEILEILQKNQCRERWCKKHAATESQRPT
jgi:hypothetical protein